MELLAPAGNLECALAAFDEGADAVYAGLKKFNARERTENFTPEEMSQLIAYAHKHGRRVYVTFNTLIKSGCADRAGYRSGQAGAALFPETHAPRLHADEPA